MKLYRFSNGSVINIDQIITYRETEYGLEVGFSDGEAGEYRSDEPEEARLISVILAIPVTHLDLSEEDLRTIQALSGKLND